MIRVTIDLLPHGEADAARTLQTLTICNIGGTEARGEYEVKLTNPDGYSAQVAYVRDWPRLKKDPAALVQAALQACGYGRKE